MAQIGKNAAYLLEWLKITKNGLPVKMAQNGKNAPCKDESKEQKRGLLEKMA